MTELGVILIVVGVIIILFSQLRLRLRKAFHDNDEDLQDLQSLMGMARSAMQMIGVAIAVIGLILFIKFF